MIIPGRCRNILFRELKEDPYLIKRIPCNDIKNFLDIGAAYGITSIQAKLNHTDMKVVAIEPDIRSYNDLRQNVDNLYIYTYNLALGNGEEFYLAKERKTPLCNRFVPKTDTSATFKSKSYTLSQLVDITKVDKNNLWIKVDTEGAERYLFDASSRDILESAKIIVMEGHGNDDVGPLDDLIKLLNDNNLDKTHVTVTMRTSSSLMNIKIVRKDYLNFLHSKGILNEIQ